MTASYVTVILDLVDGSGQQVTEGTIGWSPSQQFPGAGVGLVGQAPLTREFRAGAPPQVRVLANDTAGPQGDTTPGWTWDVHCDGVPGAPADASYYVLSTSGDTQYLSGLAAVPAAQPGAQYVPLPDTPPSDTSQVLGLSATSPLATEWVGQSGGGGGGSGTVTSVAVQAANGFTGTVADSTTTPQITLKTTVSGVLKGSSSTGAVSAAAAGTDYLAPSGSGAALTGITAAQVGADASGAAGTAQGNAETFATAAVATETSRAEAAEALALAKASNLSDIASAGTARTNLGLGSAALLASSAVAQTANNLSDLASVAAARTSLGLGTAATQATSAFLQPSDNLSDVTSAGTARTNLGLGSAATQASSAFDAAGAAATAQASAEAASLPITGGTMTGWIAPAGDALTFGSAVPVNAALGNDFTVTLTSSSGELANPTNLTAWQIIRFHIKQGSGGSYTLAYASGYSFGSGSAPTLSTAAGDVDIVAFQWDPNLSKLCYMGSAPGFS